jgi:CRISPR-associated protein Csh2
MAELIKTNSDFLFIYEAINCNPNGDPDMENKPRMDYDTNTNLVTDVRLKRYIRDFLKSIGTQIFVDLEDEQKVSPESKLKAVINNITEEGLNELLEEFPEEKEKLIVLLREKGNKPFVEILQGGKTKDLNVLLLQQLVKKQMIDVRMFGSAFAIKEFTKAYTGPIQLTWGYSLNKAKIIETSSIVTIMNDDNSTFGKDYRVYYSLLAFHGTINKAASVSTGLTEEDKETFRNAIWNSISATPTRSKLNQYPKLYVELEYNEGYANGQFGDLRNYVKSLPKTGIDEDAVRKFDDLQIDLSALINLINNNKGDNKIIKEIFVKSSPDINLNI